MLAHQDLLEILRPLFTQEVALLFLLIAALLELMEIFQQFLVSQKNLKTIMQYWVI
jgi:hypothetical protein